MPAPNREIIEIERNNHDGRRGCLSPSTPVCPRKPTISQKGHRVFLYVGLELVVSTIPHQSAFLPCEGDHKELKHAFT